MLDSGCHEVDIAEISTLSQLSALKNLTIHSSILSRFTDTLLRLIDIMPASLEQFEITQWYGFRLSEPLEGLIILSGMTSLRKTRLPQLRRIFLGNAIPYVVIDCTDDRNHTGRISNERRRQSFSYVKSYYPSTATVKKYTLNGYITWLKYRQRNRSAYASEREERKKNGRNCSWNTNCTKATVRKASHQKKKTLPFLTK